MSTAYSLGDFAEPGQLSLAAARHAPTRDVPETVGPFERTRDSLAAVATWTDGSETVEVLAVGHRDGTDYEAIATAHGRTKTIAIEPNETAAISAAVAYMEASQ